MSWAAVAVGAGSLIAGSMNKPKGGSTASYSSQEPWVDQQDHIRQMFLGAASQYGDPRSILAGQSPATLQALQMQEQRATAGSPLVGAAQTGNLATLRGDFLSPDSNPYLKGAVTTALNDARMGVNSQFNGDNYGGSAHQEWLGRSLADRALPIYAQNYESERGRQMQAGAMAPGLANQDYFDIGQLGMVGAARDARSQQQVDEPYTRLQRYQSVVGGQQYGSSGSQQSPYFTNPFASALGMGLGGMQLYNGLNKQQPGGFDPGSSYNVMGDFQPYYTGMGTGGYQYG